MVETSWGEAAVIAAQAPDGFWYAVLRDPAPGGLPVPGARGATLEAALAELTLQCGGGLEERSA